MKECAKSCKQTNTPCQNSECRKWIDYEDDLNCCLITIDEDTGNGLTLEETAKRVGLSFVRVRQIEKLALKKLSKRMQDNKTGVF
ncbi:hypothetical protein N9989_00520 [bacterium]|jgi:hypothetical protein|nr:hypothetical protein [bacterium]